MKYALSAFVALMCATQPASADLTPRNIERQLQACPTALYFGVRAPDAPNGAGVRLVVRKDGQLLAYSTSVRNGEAVVKLDRKQVLTDEVRPIYFEDLTSGGRKPLGRERDQIVRATLNSMYIKHNLCFGTSEASPLYAD